MVSFEEFVERANQTHKNKFSYDKTTFVNMSTNTEITCVSHGVFSQKPYKHLQGQGCAKCGGKNLSYNEIIQLAKEKHNNKYIYHHIDITKITQKEKINIICPEHGNFNQTIRLHLLGSGCQKCNSSCKMTKDEFLSKFFNKYPESKFDFTNSVYVNSTTKINVVCNCNHTFDIRPRELLNGNGCSVCRSITLSKRLTKPQNLLIDEINAIHGDKIDTSNVEYVATNTKCLFKCNIHNIEYLQRPHNLLQGKNGCFKCRKTKHYSKHQIQWLEFLQISQNTSISHALNGGEYKIPNTSFKADGYCSKTNTIYEYYGDYWHGNPKKYLLHEVNPSTKLTFGELYRRTKEREQQICQLGFNLVVIWESDWIKICKAVSFLQKKFRNYLKEKNKIIV
jgi:hypothetical protein